MRLSHGLPLCFKALLLLSVDGFEELRPLYAEGRGDALGRGDGGKTDTTFITANGHVRNIGDLRKLFLGHMFCLACLSDFYHLTTFFYLFGKSIIYLFG